MTDELNYASQRIYEKNSLNSETDKNQILWLHLTKLLPSRGWGRMPGPHSGTVPQTILWNLPPPTGHVISRIS